MEKRGNGHAGRWVHCWLDRDAASVPVVLVTAASLMLVLPVCLLLLVFLIATWLFVCSVQGHIVEETKTDVVSAYLNP